MDFLQHQDPKQFKTPDVNSMPADVLRSNMIEVSMRKKLDLMGLSAYPDTFDWSIYDKIARRYSENPPRGGTVFKTTFKLVNYHSTCSSCHYAFEIDSYGRGCIHDCLYCYAKDQLTARGYWNAPMPFPVDLSEIRKILYTVFETDRPSKWRNILMKRIPLRIGSMSDSFMWIDKKYGVTRELIKILNFYKYPHVIFTRSDLAATDEYLALFDKKLASIQYSLSGNDEKLNKLIEPGAPSYRRRIAALSKLSAEGIWTTARINPFFPMYPDGYYTDSERIFKKFGKDNVPKFKLFNWDIIGDLKSAKVSSVLAGFVRLSPKAIKAMSEATGINLKLFFTEEALSVSGDRKYSDSEIAYYYGKIANLCAANDLRFSTCYIGNGLKDYGQYQSLWTNRADCCDIKGNVASFQTTSQEISWAERMKHAPSLSEAEKSKAAEENYQFNFTEQFHTSSIAP